MLSTYFKPTINHGSWVDRFSSTWTFLLLFVLAGIVAIRHYLGPNVVCQMPPDIIASHTLYVQEHCWMAREIIDTSNYMYVRESLPIEFTYISRTTPDENEKNNRTLYQWLPLILVFQALLFRLPDIILRVCESTLGFGYEKINGMINMFTAHTAQERQTIAKGIGSYMYEVFGKRYLNFIPFGIITVSIALVKVLYFANAVAQLTILEEYLSPPNITSYGEYVFDSIINKNYSYIGYSPAFPRDILCNFDVILLTNVQRFTVQCVVPVNEFNEKICSFVWIWLLFVCVASGTSGVVFLLKSLLPMVRHRYVRKYLSMAKVEFNQSEVNDLSSRVIGQDGVFMLRLIGDISSDILVRDIVVSIWNENNSQAVRTSATLHPDGSANIPGDIAPIYPPIASETTRQTIASTPEKSTC